MDAVDYMICDIDGIELYAEAQPVEDDETGTYDGLRAEILKQAEAEGIDPETLHFVYDNDVDGNLEIVVDDVMETEDGKITGCYWNAASPEFGFIFTFENNLNINLGDETDPWSADESETIRRAIRKAVREYKA